MLEAFAWCCGLCTQTSRPPLLRLATVIITSIRVLYGRPPPCMNVNLNGTFNVTRLAIPHLKKSSAGSIIIISSLGGRYGYPNRSPYCTSKWGLIGFTKTLALELGEFNIRANAIAPGAVGGERIERVLEGRAKTKGKTLEQEKDAALSIQALKRFVDPKDIAALCIFLASDAGK